GPCDRDRHVTHRTSLQHSSAGISRLMFTMWNDGIFWGSGVDPQHLRITVGTDAECDALVAALREMIG
ncbi:hypothetical protein, partial [Burkholderia vietnamiensis]|uniref:hypothetical protein n=1 Tax=Burkholderia vietnamiensis TaxID=60552 RepID=UPI001CF20C57